MRQLLFKCLAAADASIDETGTLIVADQLFSVSAQAVVTGSSTGTLKLQFSNDIINQNATPPLNAPTHWSDITGATVTISGAGTFAIQKTDICARYIQAVFTHNNGSAGTITVIVNALGI